MTMSTNAALANQAEMIGVTKDASAAEGSTTCSYRAQVGKNPEGHHARTHHHAACDTNTHLTNGELERKHQHRKSQHTHSGTELTKVITEVRITDLARTHVR